jgi:hypothetical protein
MPTVNKTLTIRSTNGFSQSGGTSFDSITVNSFTCLFYKTSAIPNIYSGTVIQGASQNTYEDWGVPAGALVTGIRALSGTGGLVGTSLIAATLQIYTIEADCGAHDILFGGDFDNSGGAVQTLSNPSSDFVQVQCDVSITVDTNIEESYGNLECELNQIVFEITYEESVECSGESTGEVQLTGALSLIKNLSGSSTGSISLAGALSVIKNMSGSVSSGLSLDGLLTVDPTKYLDGTVSSGLALVGSLVVEKNLSGEISSGINLDGTPIPSVLISGTPTGAVNLSGVLSIEKNISGTSTGSVSLAGTLTIIDHSVYFSGTIIGGTRLAGRLENGSNTRNPLLDIVGRRFLEARTKKYINS